MGNSSHRTSPGRPGGASVFRTIHDGDIWCANSANGFVAACKVFCESCLTFITKLLKGLDGYRLHVLEYGFVATWQQTEGQLGAVAFIGRGLS